MIIKKYQILNNVNIEWTTGETELKFYLGKLLSRKRNISHT